MSDTPTPNPELERLTAFVGTVRTALGLTEDADADAITVALTARLGDAEKIVTDRTSALAAERDEAVAKATKMETERNAERIEAALTAAFEKSGVSPDFKPDYMLLARPLFGVKDGQVVTTGDGGEPPGMDPAQWCVARYRSLRPAHHPLSVGGGARGGGAISTGLPSGSECFDPKRPNLTSQLQYEARYGAEAARQAAARYGVTLPGGGR